MAGRGRRLGGYGENEGPLRRPGEPVVSLSNSSIGTTTLATLTEKIESVDMKQCNPQWFKEVKAGLEVLCPTEDSLQEVVRALVARVLNDSTFGKKLAYSFANLLHYYGSNSLRSFLLSAMQNHYETALASSADSPNLVNAVAFHGYVFNFAKQGNARFIVLASFLLKYLDFLLGGSEEQHKMIAKQMFLNGYHMSVLVSDEFEAMKTSLRKILIEKNLSCKSKCWVLLALDYISNSFNALQGPVRDFYLKQIGDTEYVELELTIDMSDRTISKELELCHVMNSLNIQTSPQAKSKDVQNKAKSDGRPLKGRGLRMGGKTQDLQAGKALKSKGEMDEKSKGKEKMNSVPGMRHISNRKEDELYGIQFQRENSIKVGKKILGRKNGASDASGDKSGFEDHKSKGEEAGA